MNRNRRTFMKAAVSVVCTGLVAGCSSGRSNTGSNGTSTTTTGVDSSLTATMTETPTSTQTIEEETKLRTATSSRNDFEPNKERSSVQGIDSLGFAEHSVVERQSEGPVEETEIGVRFTVKNSGSTAVSSAKAVAKFYDSDGVVLGEKPQLGIELDSGDKKEYEIVYSLDDAPAYSYYELTIEEDSIVTDQPESSSTLQGTSSGNLVSVDETSTDSSVKGVIQNTSGKVLPVVEIRVTFYDSSGTTLTEQSKTITEFESGVKRRFEVEYNGDETWQKYDLQVFVTK